MTVPCAVLWRIPAFRRRLYSRGPPFQTSPIPPAEDGTWHARLQWRGDFAVRTTIRIFVLSFGHRRLWKIYISVEVVIALIPYTCIDVYAIDYVHPTLSSKCLSIGATKFKQLFELLVAQFQPRIFRGVMPETRHHCTHLEICSFDTFHNKMTKLWSGRRPWRFCRHS